MGSVTPLRDAVPIAVPRPGVHTWVLIATTVVAPHQPPDVPEGSARVVLVARQQIALDGDTVTVAVTADPALVLGTATYLVTPAGLASVAKEASIAGTSHRVICSAGAIRNPAVVVQDQTWSYRLSTEGPADARIATVSARVVGTAICSVDHGQDATLLVIREDEVARDLEGRITSVARSERYIDAAEGIDRISAAVVWAGVPSMPTGG